MPRVFTVYHCGTNFNRERTDEVIANLATRTEGAENRDWLITDGVGSKPKHDPRAQTPGTIDPITGRKDPNAPRQARLKGIADGYGWDQNVEHALAVIKAVIAGSIDPPGVINMAGWSRGAITCLMLAHALDKDPLTRGIPVNIFALDPVPGPGQKRADRVTLSDNVLHYSAILMEDEARKVMKPMFPGPGADEKSGKRVKFVPLPGVHDTAVKYLKTTIGTLGAALAHQFLTKHGTRLRNPILLNDVQYCELYARVRLDVRTFRGMRNDGALRKMMNGPGRNVPNNFRDTAYFVNAHHARKFGNAFPSLWRMMNVGAQNQADVDRAAASVRGRAPTTYQSLVAAGIL